MINITYNPHYTVGIFYIDCMFISFSSEVHRWSVSIDRTSLRLILLLYFLIHTAIKHNKCECREIVTLTPIYVCGF